ncbi:ribosomal protein S18-alanine N-acetyltransferase [Clostridium sp. AN503]|uniref:ribosomal protein S18-alanine N-acetyltransferase n=1 Tax=Clostridium sp. AN503 TaxID=3160598 RepID=UPI003458E2CA
MIRLMKAADLEQVAELEKICFTESWSYGILEAGIHSPFDVYYVYEQNGQILGYCNLRLLAGEGEVQRIAVLPEYRRMGLARKMMEIMVDYARENHALSVSLEVRAGNLPARNLYETYGFTAEAVRKGYYRNPSEDAIIMWKRDL